ncbi:hypothetical protein GCM10009576_015700 [Streptomyces rhizosphaericus]|uniref:Uncharacterized protein n=2 Tax=Streptomyces rhizosphaericus TaxID=114699 RepID=A0ABN1QLD7_9ACTN
MEVTVVVDMEGPPFPELRGMSRPAPRGACRAEPWPPCGGAHTADLSTSKQTGRLSPDRGMGDPPVGICK